MITRSVTQSEAEAGVSTKIFSWTALRIKQAIVALGGGGASLNLHSMKEMRARFDIEHTINDSYNDDDSGSNGNGDVTLNSMRIGVETIGNNGTAFGAWDAIDALGFDPYLQSGTSAGEGKIDWDRDIAISVALQVQTISTNSELQYYFGRLSTDGVIPPDDKLIGFEIRGPSADLFTIVHDGTSVSEVDTGFNVPLNQKVFFALEWDGTTYKLFTSLDNITFTQRGGDITANAPAGIGTQDHISWTFGADNMVSGNVKGSIMQHSIFND